MRVSIGSNQSVVVDVDGLSSYKFAVTLCVSRQTNREKRELGKRVICAQLVIRVQTQVLRVQTFREQREDPGMRWLASRRVGKEEELEPLNGG